MSLKDGNKPRSQTGVQGATGTNQRATRLDGEKSSIGRSRGLRGLGYKRRLGNNEVKNVRVQGDSQARADAGGVQIAQGGQVEVNAPVLKAEAKTIYHAFYVKRITDNKFMLYPGYMTFLLVELGLSVDFTNEDVMATHLGPSPSLDVFLDDVFVDGDPVLIPEMQASQYGVYFETDAWGGLGTVVELAWLADVEGDLEAYDDSIVTNTGKYFFPIVTFATTESGYAISHIHRRSDITWTATKLGANTNTV